MYKYSKPCKNRGKKTNNPYLPNFNRTPAKIILPATGASTWAFGSHTCTKYIGVFTIKPRVNAKITYSETLGVKQERWGGRVKSTSNIGKEERTVYKTR